MKKIMMILMGILLPSLYIQAQITEFLVLEALIDNHKALSDRLRNRVIADGALVPVTKIVTDSTDTYREDIVTMQKRIEGEMAAAQFGAEIGILTLKAVGVTKHMSRAMDDAIRVSKKYPLLMTVATQATIESGQLIGDIYKLVAMVVSSSTGVVLATNENRAQFCYMIRDKLARLDRIACDLSYMANMQEMMGSCPSLTGTADDWLKEADADPYGTSSAQIQELINNL